MRFTFFFVFSAKIWI